METKMTTAMRSTLAERLADLDTRIEALHRLREEDDSLDATALSNELVAERDQISDALEQATLIDDAPFDEHAIEVGDTVTIRDGSGQSERYVLVDAGVGARVRSDWVSAMSPLGAALVGRSRGEQVWVETPGGRRCFVIVDFERAGRFAETPPPAA
jgi:transcription elongation GreA/GreB family factor